MVKTTPQVALKKSLITKILILEQVAVCIS